MKANSRSLITGFMVFVLLGVADQAVAQVQAVHSRSLTRGGGMSDAARDYQSRLEQLHAPEILNKDGGLFLTFAATIEMSDEKIKLIVRSARDYTPWIERQQWKDGQIGRFRLQYHDQTVGKVSQIIDQENMTVGLKKYGRGIVWITGYPTANLSDGSDLLMNMVLVKNGTKSYTTVAGSKRTVPLFEYNEQCRSIEKIRAETIKSPPSSRENIYRVYETKSKTHVVGKIHEFGKGTVTLESATGITQVVKLSDLQKTDKRKILKLRGHLK